ncbi:MAG: hypothetical protein Q9219_000552 [cf. Caloplaca sp. 3 TL-2023]
MSFGRLTQQAKRCLTKQSELSRLNAFTQLSTDHESILHGCQTADERHAIGQPLSAIDGQLVAIKDNICTSIQPTTCASAMLQGFQSPFPATVVEKLEASGAIVVGKTNLDEFGMGSHTVNSMLGPVKSLCSLAGQERSVGGSSGGSALAVGTEQCFAALGTDTGGSVRLPAAWTGTVGFKPSYGMVSRWGVVAYANSLDTVGVIARTVQAAKRVYDQIKGHDPHDPTSISPSSRSRIQIHLNSRTKSRPLRIGIPREYLVSELHPSIRAAWSRALESLQKKFSHSIHHISLPTTKSALSAYYVLAPAEASSNLAKYDGVRYGNRAPKTTSTSDPSRGNNVLFSSTRYHNFGPEVRRRILLGSYTLSSTAIDNYFIRAQKVRRLVQDDFNRVFAMSHPLLPAGSTSDSTHLPEKEKCEGVDVIVSPTSLNLPPLLSDLERDYERDPASQFYEDLYTVPASLAGLPAISVPAPMVEGQEKWEKIGLQIVGQYGDDELVLDVAREMEEIAK